MRNGGTDVANHRRCRADDSAVSVGARADGHDRRGGHGAALLWLGVQDAAVWGILAGVFDSIPYFGPVIVSGGRLVVGLVQGGDLAQALLMSGVALLITSIEGWLLTPLLLGKVENMTALTVFIGFMLWTWLWGTWGRILALPMLVILKSTADHVPGLARVGRLMAP